MALIELPSAFFIVKAKLSPHALYAAGAGLILSGLPSGGYVTGQLGLLMLAVHPV